LSDSGYISNLVIFCFNLVFSQSIWVRSGACVCDRSDVQGEALCAEYHQIHDLKHYFINPLSLQFFIGNTQ